MAHKDKYSDSYDGPCGCVKWGQASCHQQEPSVCNEGTRIFASTPTDMVRARPHWIRATLIAWCCIDSWHFRCRRTSCPEKKVDNSLASGCFQGRLPVRWTWWVCISALDYNCWLLNRRLNIPMRTQGLSISAGRSGAQWGIDKSTHVHTMTWSRLHIWSRSFSPVDQSLVPSSTPDVHMGIGAAWDVVQRRSFLPGWHWKSCRKCHWGSCESGGSEYMTTRHSHVYRRRVHQSRPRASDAVAGLGHGDDAPEKLKPMSAASLTRYNPVPSTPEGVSSSGHESAAGQKRMVQCAPCVYHNCGGQLWGARVIWTELRNAVAQYKRQSTAQAGQQPQRVATQQGPVIPMWGHVDKLSRWVPQR